MKPLYITNITIDKVRHLQDIQIPVSDDSLKHLIITGKNGSGKTSLLDALADYLKAVTTSNDSSAAERRLQKYLKNLENLEQNMQNDTLAYRLEETEKRIEGYRNQIQAAKSGLMLHFQFLRKRFCFATKRVNLLSLITELIVYLKQ